MTLLSRKADYALLIVSYLYHKPAGGTARAIADRYGLSRPFVANILKELAHAGFVVSHRGVKGGYALRAAAAGATLADLLEAIREGFRLTVCNDPGDPAGACGLEPGCPVKSPLAEVHRRIAGVLRGVTLADLVAPGAAPPGPLTGLLPLVPAGPRSCCSAGECRHPPEPAPL